MLVFDASQTVSVDALHIQALELFLRRSGIRVLTLPVDLQGGRIANAVAALGPDAVVLGGAGTSLDALSRLVYAVRQSAREVEVMNFRGALPDSGASTVKQLGDEPEAATAALHEQFSLQRHASSARRSPAAAHAGD